MFGISVCVLMTGGKGQGDDECVGVMCSMKSRTEEQ